MEINDMSSALQTLHDEIKCIQFQNNTFKNIHDLKEHVDEAQRALGM
jgi:hypothetical protein